MGKLFGTDGIRGVAGRSPLTNSEVFRLGRAAGLVLRKNLGRIPIRVVSVRDTRASGQKILEQLAKGHAAYGVKREHFRPMGQALIATMRETLGDRFPKGADAAWEVAYDHLAQEMAQLAG